MVKVLAHFYFKEGVFDEVKVLAGELVTKTQAEDGCIQYELIQSNDDPLHMIMQEDWTTQAALDAHCKTEHFLRLVPKLGELCAKPGEAFKYTRFA